MLHLNSWMAPCCLCAAINEQMTTKLPKESLILGKIGRVGISASNFMLPSQKMENCVHLPSHKLACMKNIRWKNFLAALQRLLWVTAPMEEKTYAPGCGKNMAPIFLLQHFIDRKK